VDAERLAAYLAGELDADETVALEAMLAREPGARTQLEAMRRADTALDSLAPTELPEGFERRLRAAVDTELAVQLGTTPQEGTAHGHDADGPAAVPDQLADRRSRRSRSWLPAFAGAAAAIVVLGGVVIGVGGLGGAGDDAATDSMMTLEADDTDAGTADDEVAAEALPGPGDVPTLVAGDRELDDDLADELLESIELLAVTEQQLEPPAGRSLAASWRDALHLALPGGSDAGAQDPPEAATDGDAEGPVEERSLEPSGLVRLLTDGPLTAEDGAAISRCLDEVLAGGDDAIPAYVELASYEGGPAVVLGLVTFDPATGAFSRPEVWILDREDCQVRRFSQG
jgi:hypothetical protein